MRVYEFTEEEANDFERILENEWRGQGDDMDWEDSLKIENYSPLLRKFYSQEDLD